MTFLGFLVLLAVAAVCGSIGASLAGYSYGGCLTNIALGLIGAFIGSWLSGELGIPEGPVIVGIPILWTIAGSALFVAVLGMLAGGKRRKGN